jgi:hypothetical protein
MRPRHWPKWCSWWICANVEAVYEEGQAINNQIVRERFNLNKNQTVMASRILADALESGLIKMKDPETESKRYTSYIPYYGWLFIFTRNHTKVKITDYQVLPIFSRNHIIKVPSVQPLLSLYLGACMALAIWWHLRAKDSSSSLSFFLGSSLLPPPPP